MRFYRRITAILLITCVCLLGMSGVASGQNLQDSRNLWLVNREHKIAENYMPEDMRAAEGSTRSMRAEAVTEFNKMRSDALSQGAGKIYASSGYRSFQKQQSLFSERLRTRQRSGMSYTAAYNATVLFTAAPGMSEHQTGLAVDITNGGALNGNYDKTKQGAWIKKNCWKYGFILRYDGSKTKLTGIGNEPWHFRYVGKPHAQIITEKGWCLEEYISYLQTNGILTVPAENGMAYDIYWSKNKYTSVPDAIAFSSDNCGGYITTSYYKKNPAEGAAGHWSEPYFKKFFNGREMNFHATVSPDRAITRAEFAVLCSLLPLKETAGDVSFSDVSENAWYRESLFKTVRMGLMSGTGAKIFSPDGRMTREMAAAVMSKAIESDKIEMISFSDTDRVSSWAFQSVQKIVYNKIMSGYSDNTFRAKEYISWGEAVAGMCKLLDLIETAE